MSITTKSLSFATKIVVIYFQFFSNVVLTNEDHKRVVIEGIGIIESVNAPFVADEQPFVLVGDPKSLDMKSFWYKVRCTICNDFFQQCPPKKNLERNLKNHMEETKHAKVIEDVLSKKGL